MAESDDTPDSLAGLLMKRRSAGRSTGPASRIAAAATRPFEPQLGLHFSAPIAEPPAVPSGGKRAEETVPASLAPKAAAALVLAGPMPSERRIWTVLALVTKIRQTVETGYDGIWVEGEISNCRAASSGHIYFTLKDGEAQLPVVLFRRQAQMLRFRPQDGLAVLACGRVSVYESRGQLQLIAETLEPRGAGALQLAFEQTKARLKAEGLFEADRKRPLPAFPRCIGLVTSPHGAVLRDIATVIRRRHGRLNLLVYPALMQGGGCASTVAAGIRWFNRHPEQADVILLARGGGSIEDLAGFNDEGLARAIAGSALPVVSAIGHETDFTIADFVADLRAPTPSAAAEMITSAQHRIEERVAALRGRALRAVRYQMAMMRQRFGALSAPQMLGRVQAFAGRRQQRLDDLRHRLEGSTQRRLRLPAARLAALKGRLERQNPALRLAVARQRLGRAEQSLTRLAHTMTRSRTARLEHTRARLEALSPLAVLSRGYAIVYSASGEVLRDARSVEPGQQIRARLGQGDLEAQVIRTRTMENQ